MIRVVGSIDELSSEVGDGGNSERAAYRGALDASTSPPKERYAVSNDQPAGPELPLIFVNSRDPVSR